jgi:PAS domain-containing protein
MVGDEERSREALLVDLARAEARIATLEAEAVQAAQQATTLRTILENAGAYVAHLTPEGDYLYLNKFAPGFSQADIAGVSSFAFTDPKDHGALRACIEQVRRTKAPSAFASVNPGAHGSPTRYFQMLAPVVKNGEVVSLVVVALDVSVLIEPMAALEEGEAKLRVALAASGMGLWSFDPEREEGGEADAQTSAIFGIAPGATVPEHFACVAEGDRTRVRAALAEAIEGDAPYGPIEHRVVCVVSSVPRSSSSPICAPHAL